MKIADTTASESDKGSSGSAASDTSDRTPEKNDQVAGQTNDDSPSSNTSVGNSEVEHSTRNDPQVDPSPSVDPQKNPTDREPSVAPAPKHALPSSERQQEILSLIEQAYKVSEATTADAKSKLATELFDASKQSADKPDEQFVLLKTTMELARDGGNAALMLAAADSMAAFQLDLRLVKRTFLIQFAREAKTSVAIGSLVEAAKPFVEELMRFDSVSDAYAVARAIYAAANRPRAHAPRSQTGPRSIQAC